MFDSPRSYTLPDLFERDDLIERDVTLTCVSNEVGGRLAGTARWLGVPLGAFLRENGIRSGSDQLVCRDVNGMTIGAPTRSALEVEDAMLAFGMNGEPLPVEHGFPVRMLIPGLYGYVSACKWLTGIEATTFDAFDAYWIERDWAAEGPIKVASRIDTPAPLREFPAGRRAIAGVAWAQTRGIASVEVRVDEEDWVEAELSPEVDADLWRQWVLPYDFPPAGTRSPSAPPAPTARGRPRPRRAVPLRLHRLALHPGGRRMTRAGLRPAPDSSRHPAGDATPDRDRGRRTTRPRQCGRTDRTRSTIPVKRNLLTRGVLITAVSTLAITLSACGSDDSADTAAPPPTPAAAEMAATGDQRGADVRRAVRRRLLRRPRRGRGQLHRDDRRPGRHRRQQQPGTVHAGRRRDRRQPGRHAEHHRRHHRAGPGQPGVRGGPGRTRSTRCWPTPRR